ncbi:MAG: homoserine O-acetyltransferase [Cellvibrionaceae bacterium]|jgi:homoserine O-acetyltransferase
MDEFPQGSVGLVQPQTQHFDTPLLLANGRVLPAYQLIYETYGELNADKSNAVLICHALSGDHHAAGFHSSEDKQPGWWNNYVGPGKAINTDNFFVVSINNLGGCNGSTGPLTINKETGKPWGADFPTLRVRDWVESQKHLADLLGIYCWAAIVGGSLGGMQAMRWATEYPERVGHCIAIASALKLTAQNIAFNETARQAIMADPEFFNGNYNEHGTIPKHGLAVARMIGHITYLSGDGMGEKFGRELRSGSFSLGCNDPLEFEIESYLRYQGAKFSTQFDANTYILMTRALDYFDLAREYQDNVIDAFSHATCKFLVISFTTDWRFSPKRSKEIVQALLHAKKSVSYAEIESSYGHDAFLVPNKRYNDVFSSFMKNIVADIKPISNKPPSSIQGEL